MGKRTVPYHDVCATSFCNKQHRLSNGHPVNHECYILVPEALKLEKEGRPEDACKLGIRTDRILDPREVEIEGPSSYRNPEVKP